MKLLTFSLFTIGFLLFSATYSDGAPPPDDNDKGYALYLKGNYTEAAKLFQSAVKANPKHPWAWFNLARVTFLLNEKKDASACEQETNWLFEVLYLMTQATDVNATGVLAKLKEKDNKLQNLMTKPEFKKWLAATIPLPTDDKKLSDYLIVHPMWWPYENTFPPMALKLDSKGGASTVIEPTGKVSKKGSWSVKDKKIQVALGAILYSFTLTQTKSFFDQGRKSYNVLQLTETHHGGQIPRFVQGPRFGDCGEYNF